MPWNADTLVFALDICTHVCTASTGLNVLFSGAADEVSLAANAYDILIPAFHSALLTNQPPVSLALTNNHMTVSGYKPEAEA